MIHREIGGRKMDFGGNNGGVVKLSKGQKVNLGKEFNRLKNITVGLGWDVNTAGGPDFDLDASAFLCDKDDRSRGDWMVFYNNSIGPNRCCEHTGDDRTGGNSDEGDDEQILIDLEKVPEGVHKIVITVTIFDAKNRRQNFGDVENAYIRLVNNETDKEVLRYDMTEDFSIETAVIVAEIYRVSGGWEFSPVGEGYEGGLMTLCRKYGIDAEE